jgi:hypothetical protein
VLLRTEMGLDRAPTHSRSLRHPGLRWVAIAAIFAAIALVAQAFLPPQRGGPFTSAADEFRRLGRIASSRAAVDIPGGLYLYTREQILTIDSSSFLDSNVRWTFSTRAVFERWRRADGSGRQVRTVKRVLFLSEADEQAARANDFLGVPEAGEVNKQRFAPGDLPLPDLSDLPTEPERLKPILESGDFFEDTDVREPAHLATAIGELLARPDAPPELRLALFQILAGLPSSRFLGDVTDPLGRSGVGVEIPDGFWRTKYVFDPDTAALLALLNTSTIGPAAGVPSWFAFDMSGVVDRVGQRPPPQALP